MSTKETRQKRTATLQNKTRSDPIAESVGVLVEEQQSRPTLSPRVLKRECPLAARKQARMQELASRYD